MTVAEPVAVLSQPPKAPFTRSDWFAVIGLSLNFIGIAVVIVTLWQTNLALRQAREPIRSGIYVSMAQWTLDIDKTFIEHPQMRPYFYAGKTIDPSDDDYNKAVSIAEMTIDTMDSVLQNKEYFPKGVPHKGWDNWIDDNFSNSPIIREHMTRYAVWIEGSELLARWEKWKREHPNIEIRPLSEGK